MVRLCFEFLKFFKNCYLQDPYWEQLCQKEEMTLNDFFKTSKQESDNWLYYDYKYLKDVFQVDDSTLNVGQFFYYYWFLCTEHEI